MPWPIDIRCAQRFQSTRAQGQSLSTTAFGYPVDIPPPAYAAQASFPFPVRLEPLAGLRFWWRRSQASLEAFSKKSQKEPRGKSFSGLQAADGRSFFAVYLQSSLEVLREFTIRVQCLVASSRRKGVKALSLAQLQASKLSNALQK